MAGLRVCRKCLPMESREAFLENLKQYIDNLTEEERVSQEVYERRLDLCVHCDQMTEGMCRLCGCYVELRASLKVRKCPGIPSKWDRCL